MMGPSLRRRAQVLGTCLSLFVALLTAAWTSAGYQSAKPSARNPGTVSAHLRPNAPPRAAIPVVLESRPTRSAVTGDTRPNIVLITTDDQTMSDIAWMPHVRHLIAEQGVTFTNALSPHPLCCPARAEILTGQYAQNNGVRTNAPPLGSFLRLRSSHTIATWLHAARYQTAFIGKYLNQFQLAVTPQAGWDIFNPTLDGVYAYYDYTMFNNGRPKRYQKLYNSDLLARQTSRYIERFSTSGQPFFLWASYVAPHGQCAEVHELTCWKTAVPAHRDARKFSDTRSPSLTDPAFDEDDVSDKPPDLANNALVHRGAINERFRSRIRSLQAVDRAVVRTVRTLRQTGELDNTLIVFTTDNAYLLGEHRRRGKNAPYEQALRIPLMMRGPGVPAGQTRAQTATLLDLAPTFLRLAKQPATLRIDGRALQPYLEQASAPGPDTVLIQAGPRPGERAGWHFRGVRTDRYTYVHYKVTGFTELYDRSLDPAQLRNVAGDPGYIDIEHELARRTRVLGRCSGEACRVRFGRLPQPLPMPLMTPSR